MEEEPEKDRTWIFLLPLPKLLRFFSGWRSSAFTGEIHGSFYSLWVFFHLFSFSCREKLRNSKGLDSPGESPEGKIQGPRKGAIRPSASSSSTRNDKAVYTTASVPCGWAGAVMWGAGAAGGAVYTATSVPSDWA